MPSASTDDPQACDAMDVLARYVLRNHRGPLAATVVSYDPAKRTATVQPVRRRRVRGTVYDEPPVADLPVGWWRFGGMVLAGELQPGDQVLVVPCERETRPFLLSGQAHDPQSQRMHQLENGVVLPWISSFARAITARVPGTLWIGREDGTAGVTITMGPLPGRTTLEGTGPGSIALGSAAVSPVVQHVAYSSAWGGLAGTIASAYSAWLSATGGGAAPTAVANGAFILAIGPAFATFGGLVAAMATVKTVAE